MFAACVINIWKKEGKLNGTYILSLLFCYFPPKQFFQTCAPSIPDTTSVSCWCLQQVPQRYWKQASKTLELPGVTKQFYTWASAHSRNTAAFIFPCWDRRLENILLIKKNYKWIATEAYDLYNSYLLFLSVLSQEFLPQIKCCTSMCKDYMYQDPIM